MGNLIYRVGLLGFLITLLLSCNKVAEKPNVLLLYMDDLRPELACYGQEHIQSPNIDALAAKGVQFNNAYCNVAVCGASRASMLTGLRPTQHRFRDYKTFVQNDAAGVITLPQLFKQNGYTTISNGKIYHHLDDRMSDWDEVWRPYAFDENPEGLKPTDWWESLWRDYLNADNAGIYKATNRGPAFEKADVPDSAYIDGLMTKKVLKDLEKLKDTHQPFLLTAGFISPHLPFNAPARHWENYKRTEVNQPLNNKAAASEPEALRFASHELRQYTGIPPLDERLNDEMAISLIHGYYATVSYVDALIGQILLKLEELELDKNTIVVLVADHGFNLQEHGQWGKWTYHLTSTQVPLIIASPTINGNGNTQALVELVDLYPTLVELCQLDNAPEQLDGTSMLPLLKDHGLEGKDYVLINNRNAYTIKTLQYSYTELLSVNNNEVIARALYDHSLDSKEEVNVAEQAAYTHVVDRLHAILHSDFQYNIALEHDGLED
ncbi:sulfatase [Carboxylicivirga marina]|uniref:Sulfatase n=1 Tax=Carboxylicivirga marina TaxID=2800988 RepID=A0ABS1HM37_9BACT|nr:sulfatase [Carboxylicivirga marina]MBK3518224.1 sulfatase [Carboxylicivirga marina]